MTTLPKHHETHGEPLLQVRTLSKAFPGVQALSAVSFDLQAGEVHALMGENGAGKSTLMKILAGVYAGDSGEIILNGERVNVSSPRAAQHLGIGIVHQELNLMNHLTAGQNLFIGREPRGRFGLLDEKALNKQALALFARLNLRLDPQTLVGDLTVARQQMVEIAKALSFDSRVLIMDEPTAALNDAEINELFRILRQLRAQGVGIIYISHKMDELKRIADRVTVMRDGRVIGTLPAAETPIAQIISMMVGREVDDHTTANKATAANEVVLRVRGLCRDRAIQNVNFELRRGEILGFAGLMGAGRTEVARAVFGADPIDEGQIEVHGHNVQIKTPRDAVKLGIGYLSEDRKHFGLALGLDVETNIALSSLDRFTNWMGLVNEKQTAKAGHDYVERLDIKTPALSQLVGLLSGGNQQKIVIAKWLLRDCDILFFDEPTRGIDVGAKSEIYKLLESLADEGRAVVVISSELPEILRLSHRVLVMCEGAITGELTAAEATQEKIMHFATLRETAVAT